MTVVAIHPENGKKAQGEFTVIREYTQAEREAKEQAEAEKRQRKVAEWQASPAGQICTSNPGWTRDECRALADGKIWIGMHYDMLVWRRGKPDHVNVSNYGYGNQYQYCWTYYTPSCFYDRDNDGLLDSYN